MIINQDSLNAWGNPRGYAIHPGPLCKLKNLENKRTEKSVEWAKHHLAVSKRKDEEPKSSSMWNMNLPGRPPVDFAKVSQSLPHFSKPSLYRLLNVRVQSSSTTSLSFKRISSFGSIWGHIIFRGLRVSSPLVLLGLSVCDR